MPRDGVPLQNYPNKYSANLSALSATRPSTKSTAMYTAKSTTSRVASAESAGAHTDRGQANDKAREKDRHPALKRVHFSQHGIEFLSYMSVFSSFSKIWANG